MHWIPPDTIRVFVPAGTPLRYISGRVDGTDLKEVTAEEYTVDIEVSSAGIEELARRACKNRSRKSVDGPLSAKALRKVETKVVPR